MYKSYPNVKDIICTHFNLHTRRRPFHVNLFPQSLEGWGRGKESFILSFPTSTVSLIPAFLNKGSLILLFPNGTLRSSLVGLDGESLNLLSETPTEGFVPVLLNEESLFSLIPDGTLIVHFVVRNSAGMFRSSLNEWGIAHFVVP